MKKEASFMIIMLMVFLSPSYALNETDNSTAIINETIADPGTTPDSFFYFLDLAIEKLSLAFTFNKEARIQKELEYAEERLAEARAMALEGNIEAMKKAEQNHEKLLLNINQKLNETNQTQIKVKVEEHMGKIEIVNNELKIKIKAKGNFTEEDLAFIDDMLRRFGNRSGELEIEIEREQEREQEMEQETEQERHNQDNETENDDHRNNETNSHHNENANYNNDDETEENNSTMGGDSDEESSSESDSGGTGEGATESEDDNHDSEGHHEEDE